MVSLFQRVWRKSTEWRFLRGARAVLGTPPVRAQDDGVVIFSMIGTKVLLPYLLAAKSFHAQLQRGRFVILDDGTLTASDCAVLARHLDGPEIRGIADVALGDCPKGGCWERLLTLLELRREAYVIQLDSDTVTLGPVAEVAAAIDAGRDFTLRGDETSTWRPASDFARELTPGTHVQAQIEAVLHSIDAGLPQPCHYVRGCAGFAGFAKGGHSREVADAFSREAARLLGREVWAQWGSEQVMSNVIVANEGEPVLLPYDRYLNYWGEPGLGSAVFAHFLGTCRYERGMYGQAAARVVAMLGRG